MNWFWRLYEKFLAVDDKIQAQPLNKKVNEQTEKDFGFLVK